MGIEIKKSCYFQFALFMLTFEDMSSQLPSLHHASTMPSGTLIPWNYKPCKLYLLGLTLAMVLYLSQQKAANAVAMIRVTSEPFYRKLGQALKNHYLGMNGLPGVTEPVNYTVEVQTQTNLIPKFLS